jgi:hypothetical protein
VLHVATVHFKSPRWIPVQIRELQRHLSVPFQTWTSLQGIDASYGRYFDHVLNQKGWHAEKLNHLALEIAHQADDDDLLMFLDGDAFPIADPLPLVESALSRAELVAVVRTENNLDRQPHPCFCVTRVGTWRSLPGDWSQGYMWKTSSGELESDVGGNLLRQLELSGTRWAPLHRTNSHDLHPLFFGIYGNAIYHHGAGFRWPFARIDKVHVEPLKPLPVPLLGPLVQQLDSRLRVRLKRRKVIRRNLRNSERLLAQIEADDPAWLRVIA